MHHHPAPAHLTLHQPTTMVHHGHHLAKVALAALWGQEPIAKYHFFHVHNFPLSTHPVIVNFYDNVFLSGFLFIQNRLKRPLSASDGMAISAILLLPAPLTLCPGPGAEDTEGIAQRGVGENESLRSTAEKQTAVHRSV